MSLEECDVELEDGAYGDFKFTLRLLYDRKSNECVRGVLYLKEKENRIASIELPINPKLPLDPTPLLLNAAKCNFDIKDLEGLEAEIGRKATLIDFIRKPDLYMVVPQTLELWLHQYPELTLPKYYNRLPEGLKTRIENYLERKSRY
jgi:hypothetical protein